MANVQYTTWKHDRYYIILLKLGAQNLSLVSVAPTFLHLGRFDFQENGCQLGDSCKFCHLCTFQEAGWDVASVQASYYGSSFGLDSKGSEMMLENPLNSSQF